MKREERRQAIMDLLIAARAVDLDDLAGRFAVSKMTIHRDLDDLEQTGLLRKVRGGSGRSSTAKKAIAWLGAKFSVSDHPAAPPDRQRFHFYYLYALERIGDLSKTKKMGRHKWYDEGARWLLANQHQSGMWQGTQRGREISATCFAILFLERAMKVATGGRKR